MIESELSRPVKVKAVVEEPYRIEATEAERGALAKRFSLSTLNLLDAEVQLTPKGNDVLAEGQLRAKYPIRPQRRCHGLS